MSRSLAGVLGVISCGGFASADPSQVHILTRCSDDGEQMHFAYHESVQQEPASEVASSCHRGDTELALRFTPVACEGYATWKMSFEMNGRSIFSSHNGCSVLDRPDYGWVSVQGDAFVRCHQTGQPRNRIRHLLFDTFSLDMTCVKTALPDRG